jgi:hypothetical protein
MFPSEKFPLSDFDQYYKAAIDVYNETTGKKEKAEQEQAVMNPVKKFVARKAPASTFTRSISHQPQTQIKRLQTPADQHVK